MDNVTKKLQASYDRIAEEYVQRYFDELKHKPIDCELLDRFADSVRDLGPVCDLGCGPGQIARYLHNRGVDSFGVDLSPAMVALARTLNSGIDFKQGDMFALDAEDESWGGIAAFYSIIHIPRESVVSTLCELKRVLKPGGMLLISFHVGQEIMHLDELWGEEVSMDLFFFTGIEMERYLKSAGFEIKEIIEREPYENVEYQSRRAYIISKKPLQLKT